MPKIMEVIASETGGKSYKTFKYSFDSIGLPSIDYDNNENKVMKWKEQAETIDQTTSVSLLPLANTIQNKTPLFTYFLDGSRRVFKVDDISYNKRVFPVIAGQVGVGCCKRIKKKMKQERFYKDLLIALPENCEQDSWNNTFYSGNLMTLNERMKSNRLKVEFSALLPYKTSKDNSGEAKFEDRGIAVIQDFMIEAEKKLVAELVRERKLNQHNYLMKDGSLEYKTVKNSDDDIKVLQKIKNNYKWVVGVSKSFNPESLLDIKTGKPNANYIVELPLYHRTPVAKYVNGYSGDVTFAVWYIRIRDSRRTLTPFDGVVKVEKILMDSELDSGIDSDIVNLISANIINERNPTCYGTDKRWANHLYPIYLTESFIKSKYMSNELFLSLF